MKCENHENHENILNIIDVSIPLLWFLDPVFLLNVFSPCVNLLPILVVDDGEAVQAEPCDAAHGSSCPATGCGQW